MNSSIQLRLLGPFRLERAGQPVTTFKSNKVRALLAYLAVERQHAHHRDVLADLLWPASSNALASLRDALSNLRRVLDDRDADLPIIRVVSDTLQLNPLALSQGLIRLDVAAVADLASDASEAALERATARYRGDFLEGLTLSGCPDFEAWALLHREGYRRQILNILYRLTTFRLQRGDYAQAQDSARRQLALDGYNEDAHRQLIRALAFDGQRNRALAHYAAYAEMLEEDLGVAPDIRTAALYQRIRDRRLQPHSQPAPANILSDDAMPFVGREAELARLEVALQQAQRGAGQVRFVTGEAGSGKTMLVQAFAHRVLARADDIVVARGVCNAQIGAGDPYLPFREILRLLIGDFDLPATDRVLTLAYEQQLEAFVPTVMRALRAQGPNVIGRLVPAHPGMAGMDDPFEGEGRREERTPSNRTTPSPAALCDQVTRVLRAVAERCVLILVLDDLQWADSGTLNLLAHLGRRLSGSRLLLIGLYRPVERASDHPLASTVHELQRMHGDILVDLDQAGGAEFVDAFLDGMPNAFDASFRAQLARQTGGHALFTAALIQQMQEDGALVQDAEGRWRVGADLDWSQMPPRVEAVIAQRIARLPDKYQDLLALASVEGEIFTAEVLARALNRPVAGVEHELRVLGEDELSGAQHHLIHALGLERIAGRRVARYQFRHALFQQYLSARLDSVQRARHHEIIGNAMETLYAEHPDPVAAQLAYHFEAAGLLEKAVGYFLRAGKQAYQLSAPVEAIKLSRRGLALLDQLPASTARARLELALQMSLEAPLLVTQGWGAPERAAVLERAYALARQLEDTPHRLIALYDLADLCTAQAKHPQALRYAEQLLALAQQAGDQGYEALGYRMTGTTYFFLGHYPEARAHLENGLACYAAVMRQASYAGSAPIERAVFLWAWLPHILLALGYPEQAAARSREAMACVQPDGPAYAQAMMLTIARVTFHAFARQPEATLRYAEELLTLAERYDLTTFRGWAIFCRGWGRMALGQTQAGLRDMLTGWEHLQAADAQGSQPTLLTLLAEAYLKRGNLKKSAATLRQALTLARQQDERSHLAEIYRVQGKLHLKQHEPEAAEVSLLRAIEIAQEQTAKLWELRATLDLARLWQDQGRGELGRARVAQLYEWFTEGFDTPDLQEAAALLGDGPGSSPAST
jgi:adenylate cyclase